MLNHCIKDCTPAKASSNVLTLEAIMVSEKESEAKLVAMLIIQQVTLSNCDPICSCCMPLPEPTLHATPLNQLGAAPLITTAAQNTSYSVHQSVL